MIETFTLRDSYSNLYIVECKEEKERPISFVTYTKIISGFLQFIMRKVFQGYDVKLSGGMSLGGIGVRGRKQTPKIDEKTGQIIGLAPDWVKTKKLWDSNPEAKEKKEMIYHMNDHTNGIRYKLIWYRIGMKIGNKSLYSLVFTKGPNGNGRRLNKKILEETEYNVVQPKYEENGFKTKRSKKGINESNF